MIVSKISLVNFRTYEAITYKPSPGINIIEGPNGCGKSNLAESIHFLSLSKSWRTNDTNELIKFGTSGSVIEARVEASGISKLLGISLNPGNKKKVAINGKSIKRLSELSKCINVLLFSPEDVTIFKGSPGARRNFLDVNISKTSLDYMSLIGRHNKLLDERNAVLKQNEIDRDYLDVITDRLIEVQEPLIRYRRLYAEGLNKILTRLASALYGGNRELKIEYKPYIKDGPGFADRARKAYLKTLESDIRYKTTSTGIHREDFSTKLDGMDIASFGSQGENRLASIALKISPYFAIEEEAEKPIVVLDDIYSELDKQHSDNLSELLKTMGQVFITSTNLEIEGATKFIVPQPNTRRI
ncbi:MAG: DNA replication and repair protein RecF [Bacilli bacterium]|nr:DNA replication and repair protein RecF [Bacilli bacterium]